VTFPDAGAVNDLVGRFLAPLRIPSTVGLSGEVPPPIEQPASVRLASGPHYEAAAAQQNEPEAKAHTGSPVQIPSDEERGTDNNPRPAERGDPSTQACPPTIRHRAQCRSVLEGHSRALAQPRLDSPGAEPMLRV